MSAISYIDKFGERNPENVKENMLGDFWGICTDCKKEKEYYTILCDVCSKCLDKRNNKEE